MTSKLTITREQATDKEIQMLIDSHENGTAMFLRVDAYYLMAKELQERRKAAMDSEPVAWMHSNNDIGIPAITVSQKIGHYWMAEFENVQPLYRHAQPAPERDRVRREHAEWSQATFGNVGPIGPLKHLSKEALEAAAEPDDLSEWADMQFLLWDAQRRAGITDEQITQAMIEKLAVNKQREWPEPKDGEPRLHIKEQPAPVVPVKIPGSVYQVIYQECGGFVDCDANAQTIWDACRAAMLQAQSEDDDGEPTDDERIMAIEGIHNCERCGDEGWIVGEMGITSCACGQAGTLINEGTIQAGNSPVITGAEQRIADAVELLQKAAPAMLADNSGPDGPLAGRLKSPVIPDGSAYMLRRWLAFGRGMQNAGSQLPHNLIAETESMLSAAPQLPGSEPATVPGKWIPVSERMPEDSGRYWCYVEEQNDLGKSHYQWNCSWNGDRWWVESEGGGIVTHWMPLPAAPQEVR